MSLNKENFGIIHILNFDPIGNKEDTILLLDIDLIEFLNNLEEELIELNLKINGIEKQDLTKKWGEKFWKVN